MDKPNKKKIKGYKPNFRRNTEVHKEPIHVIKLNKAASKSRSLADCWNLYLKDISYDEYAHFNGKLKAVEIFLTMANYSPNSISQSRYFTVNVGSILKNKVFLTHWPEFQQDLVDTPNIVIGLFGFAMEQFILNNMIKATDDDNTVAASETLPVTLNARFIGLENYLPFQDLKHHNYGKFVSVIGTVVRVSDEKPFCTHMAFSCVKCQTNQIVLQNKGCYTTPNTCSGDGCFSRLFKPLLNSPLTQTVPRKYIYLQELNMDNNEGGRVPRTVECELTCDLTDSGMPGDILVVSGIVVTSNTDENKTFRKNACFYVLSIFANSVMCLKGKNVDNNSSCFYLKSEDLTAVKKIHAEKNLFRLIVASLCPNIYGHELIKAGLVLGLFGGRDKTQKEGKKDEFHVRENSHILIVGDPGLGKSQMLLACANVSPRGVYVCGNSTTSSGLTVTISKESGGENSLEAGALVLADQGHCCIDEFDKMMHQHSALLEAMEQQTISLAKSGVVCTLPARTSILAAANPSGGHYNKAKTVSENLKIGGALLSRFDLVFIVQDESDYEVDSKMSKHVMNLVTNKKSSIDATSSVSSYFAGVGEDNSLSKRLKIDSNEKLNIIPPSVLQKYISYARKFSQPKLIPEVCEILKNFYLDMRKQHRLSYSTPITTRQLESLIRLTEARARTELRTFCTKSDALDVIEIMKYSMRETYSDEYGNLDFDRSIHGSGMSKSSQAKKLINMMTRAASTRGDDCFSTPEIQQLCNTLKIPGNAVFGMIETLNDQGFLLKKGHQLYQIQTL